MSSYLITGASRGIGLELTKQLLALPTKEVSLVIATSRSAADGELASLLSNNSERLAHVSLAVDSDSSVASAASEVNTILTKRNFAGLDVLVNNAGISNREPKGVKAVPAADLLRILDTNVVGVQRVISALLPSLEKGREKKVINVSSTLGSMKYAAFTKDVQTQAYKVSKAALNMLNLQYATEHEGTGFTFLNLSPGWLQTDLGSVHADLPVQTGVEATLKIILEASPAQNGQFVNIKIDGKWSERYPGGEVPF